MPSTPPRRSMPRSWSWHSTASRRRICNLIAELAAKHRLPSIFATKEYVDVGGLLSYGANDPHLYQRAATYVDRILKGAKPGDLPVEQPTKFELAISRKAARALGLSIPPSLLFRAEHVID